MSRDSGIRTPGLLAILEMSDEDVVRLVTEGLDRALDSPPRVQVDVGDTLIDEGEEIDRVFVVLSGRVARSSDHDRGEDMGPIVGLSWLTEGRCAPCPLRAAEAVTAIPLTKEQVSEAFETGPALATPLMSLALRSLARSEARADDLERENAATQHQLLDSAKMAALGQLATGIAHELNNPVAAIQRAADFITEDIQAILAAQPNTEDLRRRLTEALQSMTIATVEQRRMRRELADALGDPALAQRLTASGLSDPKECRSLLEGLDPDARDQLLEDLKRHHQLGISLRNTRTCAERITDLVRSLRAYVRSEQTPVVGVDVNQGVEDTLLLFGHHMDGTDVERRLGELPVIECLQGEISQVWTNIISNALEAMGDRGHLLIETDAPDPDHVRVRVTDTGHGILPDHMDRIFEPHFTTKSGRDEFGLGLGLAICRRIVDRHRGAIAINSEPGCTCVSVTLPTRFTSVTGAESAE